MKRYTNIALTAILSLTFAGCQQEIGYHDKGNDNSAEPVQGSIVASLATPETKSAIDDHGKGHFAGVVWTDGDALGVYESSASTTQAQYSYTGEPAAIATFGSTAALDEPKYAYYPYSAANDGKAPTSLVGNLPATQDAVLVNGAWTGLHGDYKVGTNRLSESKERFNFKNIFSLARIVISGDNTPLCGERLTKVEISATRSGSSVNIAGDFTFDATTGNYTVGTTNLSNTITINWPAGQGPVLTYGQETTCYLTMFPVVSVGDTFSIKVYTEVCRAECTAVSKAAFAAGTIYTFPVKPENYTPTYIDSNGDRLVLTNVTKNFTCAIMNFEGIGSNAETFAGKVNGLTNKWDFFAITNMGSNNATFAGAVSQYYNAATPAEETAATADGVNFFAKSGLDIPVDGTILPATYNNKTVEYRHFVMDLDPTHKTQHQHVDVYVASLSKTPATAADQLIALKFVVKNNAEANKCPAIILSTTNLRYNINASYLQTNLIDDFKSNFANFDIEDPWIKNRRGNPAWDHDTKRYQQDFFKNAGDYSDRDLMIQSAFVSETGDRTQVLVEDKNYGSTGGNGDHLGEVIEKVWFINYTNGNKVSLSSTAYSNDVTNFNNGGGLNNMKYGTYDNVGNYRWLYYEHDLTLGIYKGSGASAKDHNIYQYKSLTSKYHFPATASFTCTYEAWVKASN